MRLIGGSHSPFVRRIAMVLEALGCDYDQEALKTGDDRERLLHYNPVGRVPALALDDGRTIIDSHAIIDFLERRYDSEWQLIPSAEARRMQVLYADAIGIAALEKLVLWFYETNRRDPALRCSATVTGYEEQILTSLHWLSKRCSQQQFVCGDTLSLADITAVSLVNTLAQVAPDLLSAPDTKCVQSLAAQVSHRFTSAR